MDGADTRPNSFHRHISPVSTIPGVKSGANGTYFVSSGVSQLDGILGGGIALGSLVIVIEDAEAPHHLLLLRTFMSQGLVHGQPVLYASPSKEPKKFLSSLPAPAANNQRLSNQPVEQKGLRIAWQYKKYFDGINHASDKSHGREQEFCNDFDLRRVLDMNLELADCICTRDPATLSALHERCKAFLAQFMRLDGNMYCNGRIVLQSLCAPHCLYSSNDWDILSFICSLKCMLWSANAVALITLPPSLVSKEICKRWQHMADTVLSLRALPDGDKELENLLTGYQDMACFLHVHKVTRKNSQVPVILNAKTFAVKLHKHRFISLEPLNQAPISGSTDSTSTVHSGCSGSSQGGALDF